MQLNWANVLAGVGFSPGSENSALLEQYWGDLATDFGLRDKSEAAVRASWKQVEQLRETSVRFQSTFNAHWDCGEKRESIIAIHRIAREIIDRDTLIVANELRKGDSRIQFQVIEAWETADEFRHWLTDDSRSLEVVNWYREVRLGTEFNPLQIESLPEELQCFKNVKILHMSAPNLNVLPVWVKVDKIVYLNGVKTH